MKQYQISTVLTVLLSHEPHCEAYMSVINNIINAHELFVLFVFVCFLVCVFFFIVFFYFVFLFVVYSYHTSLKPKDHLD